MRTDRVKDVILSQQRRKPEKMIISNLAGSKRKCVMMHNYYPNTRLLSQTLSEDRVWSSLHHKKIWLFLPIQQMWC